LWMVQRFVSASDGKLDIQTNSGQGTTVRVIFPRAESG
jgi:signal transduction histidine kinase